MDCDAELLAKPCVKTVALSLAESKGITVEGRTYRSLRRRRGAAGHVAPLHAVISVGEGDVSRAQAVLCVEGEEEKEETLVMSKGGRRMGEMRVLVRTKIRFGGTAPAMRGRSGSAGGEDDGLMMSPAAAAVKLPVAVDGV